VEHYSYHHHHNYYYYYYYYYSYYYHYQVIDSRIRVGQSALAMSEVVITEDSPLETRSSKLSSSNLDGLQLHPSSIDDDERGEEGNEDEEEKWMVSG